MFTLFLSLYCFATLDWIRFQICLRDVKLLIPKRLMNIHLLIMHMQFWKKLIKYLQKKIKRLFRVHIWHHTCLLQVHFEYMTCQLQMLLSWKRQTGMNPNFHQDAWECSPFITVKSHSPGLSYQVSDWFLTLRSVLYVPDDDNNCSRVIGHREVDSGNRLNVNFWFWAVSCMWQSPVSLFQIVAKQDTAMLIRATYFSIDFSL